LSFLRCLAVACFCLLAPLSCLGAVPPYMQLIGAPGAAPLLAGTCDSNAPPPVVRFDADLGPADTYRYSTAVVTPYFFDDEGEFNVIWNQDATLFISPFMPSTGAQALAVLPLVSPANWYAALGRVPEHTEIALRVAVYDAGGKAVAASRISWDCSTGTILSREHRGNALGSSTFALPVVEYYNATLDHYFMTADIAEVVKLDTGALVGWQRTGAVLTAYMSWSDGTNPVCRFYIPPPLGDSHFYSASPAECAEVRARFPLLFYEASDVFAVALPDAAGACPAGMMAVFRLWNGRADSNHRYTTDPLQKAAMQGIGYVAEGYGPAAVAFCTLPR